MSKSIDLIFSDFVPDRGGAPWPENPGYLVDAVNVRFTPNGYRSTYLDDFATTVPAAVPATPVACVSFANVTQPRTYVGTAHKLYESNDFGATWNDNSGASYGAGADWDFAIHGVRIIAVNPNDNPQTKLLTDPVTTDFADLSGTPPRASRVARIRDSLVLGQLVSDPYGLRWSSINDPQDWPTPGSSTALARQAGSWSLQSEYGIVTKLIGGEKFGLVFQERAITRMTYVGGDIQFTFDVYEKGQGTGFNHSAIRIGNVIYFWNSTGIYVTDGYTVTSLSLGKVDEAFVLNLLSHPNGSAILLDGVAYDHRIKSIFWPFNNAGGTDFLLGYDLALQQFKVIELAGTMLNNTLHYVHDGSAVQNAFQIPFLLDESFKLRQLSDHDDIDTTMRTGFVELEPNLRTRIKGVEVLGAAMSAEPQISIRTEDDPSNLDLADSDYEPTEKARLDNLFKARNSGRFHSFRYHDPSQGRAALVRGLRVFYDIDSGR